MGGYFSNFSLKSPPGLATFTFQASQSFGPQAFYRISVESLNGSSFAP